jgi:putative N-acetylmannosamine-6-phosphate epimerase
MACALTRKDVSRFVLAVIQAIESDHNIDEDTSFDVIGADGTARRRYWNPIKALVTAHECDLGGNPGLLASDDISKVGDIVDLIFKRVS